MKKVSDTSFGKTRASIVLVKLLNNDVNRKSIFKLITNLRRKLYSTEDIKNIKDRRHIQELLYNFYKEKATNLSLENNKKDLLLCVINAYYKSFLKKSM